MLTSSVSGGMPNHELKIIAALITGLTQKQFSSLRMFHQPKSSCIQTFRQWIVRLLSELSKFGRRAT
jgi:hypothetical protein